MLTSLKCPMCREAAVTLIEATEEFCCMECGASGIASARTGRVIRIRDRHCAMKKPPRIETIPSPPASS
jgi:hypothetical protein